MKIKETYVSHTGLIDVGRYGFFINLDRDGVFIDVEELIKQAINFPRVIFIGTPFDQKEDVGKFCKKVIKENPDITIEINVDGTSKPIAAIKAKNIIFNTHIQLKVTGIEYKLRVKEPVINWFNEAHGNFIFNVNSEDEIDEANLIILDNDISKTRVYLTFNDSDNLEDVRGWAKRYGYNFAPNFKSFLWPHDGGK
jgi:hypothetical protein